MIFYLLYANKGPLNKEPINSVQPTKNLVNNFFNLKTRITTNEIFNSKDDNYVLEVANFNETKFNEFQKSKLNIKQKIVPKIETFYL